VDLADQAEIADACGRGEHAGEGELGAAEARVAHIGKQAQRFPVLALLMAFVGVPACRLLEHPPTGGEDAMLAVGVEPRVA
jgi:hypothetical protein